MAKDDEPAWKWIGNKDDWPERYQKLSGDDLRSWRDGIAVVVGIGLLIAIISGVVSLFDGSRWGRYTLIWSPHNGESGGIIHGYWTENNCEEAALKIATDSHGTITASCYKDGK